MQVLQEKFLQDLHFSHKMIFTGKQSGSALSVLLYFILKDVLTEDIPLKFNTIDELMCFFDKMLVEPQFYNYPSVL